MPFRLAGRDGSWSPYVRIGTQVVLEVSDNGVGFPADLDFRSASTLGLKLVAIFTEQVGGTMDLTREGGTRFGLRFTPGDTFMSEAAHRILSSRTSG